MIEIIILSTRNAIMHAIYNARAIRGLEPDPSKSPSAQEHFATFSNFHWIRTYFLF